MRRIPGTTCGGIDERFLYVTKRCRIPLENIVGVRPARDGRGANLITDKGAMLICEDLQPLVAAIYGGGDSGTSRGFGANIGANIGEAVESRLVGGAAK